MVDVGGECQDDSRFTDPQKGNPFRIGSFGNPLKSMNQPKKPKISPYKLHVVSTQAISSSKPPDFHLDEFKSPVFLGQNLIHRVDAYDGIRG